MRNIKRGFTRESHRRMGLRFSGRITPNSQEHYMLFLILKSAVVVAIAFCALILEVFILVWIANKLK